MKQYIDKEAVAAEIKKRFDEYSSSILKHYDACKEAKAQELGKILTILDTLEVKEIDEELQELEKEVAEGTINRINKKRIPIELKGEVKAKFKNEFHTMWQTIHGISFANVAKPILERLCLHFAAWGVYNLKEYIEMKPEEVKLDAVKVKEVDLEKALSDLDKDIKEFVTTEEFEKDSAVYGHYWAIAKHAFELGLFSTLTWQDIRLIAEIGNDFMNSEESDNIELTDEAYYGAILDKVREQGRDAKTSWSENRKARGE